MALVCWLEENSFTECFLMKEYYCQVYLRADGTLPRIPGSICLDSNVKLFIGGISNARKCSAHSALS